MPSDWVEVSPETRANEEEVHEVRSEIWVEMTPYYYLVVLDVIK